MTSQSQNKTKTLSLPARLSLPILTCLIVGSVVIYEIPSSDATHDTRADDKKRMQTQTRILQIRNGEISPTREDYKMMRNDLLSAEAAYPNVPQDELMETQDIKVDVDNRIPCAMNTSHNNTGQIINDTCYLDGDATEWFVRDAYPKRATPAQSHKSSTKSE